MSINLGDPPSWIMVLIIGFGVLAGISNGTLDPSYSFGNTTLPVGQIGVLMIGGALALGMFYFTVDIARKV